MSGMVSYNITNESQLKQQAAHVFDGVSFDLGFTTARKSIDIEIRFKHGASHQSWNSGSMTEVQQLAQWLVSGFHAGKQKIPVPGRPVFDNYLAYYSDTMYDICIKAFNGSGTIAEKAERAGRLILRDFKRKIYTGSLAVDGNSAIYGKRKRRKGYGDAPFIATNALLSDLEVVIV